MDILACKIKYVKKAKFIIQTVNQIVTKKSATAKTTTVMERLMKDFQKLKKCVIILMIIVMELLTKAIGEIVKNFVVREKIYVLLV